MLLGLRFNVYKTYIYVYKTHVNRERTKKMKTALYRCFSKEGELLYAGITINIGRRVSDHKQHVEWMGKVHEIKLEYFETRQEALDAEAKCIAEEKPMLSIASRSGGRPKLKSRTFSVSDEERDEIGTAAEILGFGARGKGRAIVYLARAYIAKATEKNNKSS